MKINIKDFNDFLNDKFIIVEGFREHSKASEKYVDVTYIQKDGFSWKGSIPYFYRRTGLFIEAPEELAEYLKSIYPFFSKESIKDFLQMEAKRWDGEMQGKETTKGFFDKLLSLTWNSVQFDFPANPNWARRIQDIKELGYTLATNTRMQVKGKPEMDTHILLIPIPKGGVTGYEVISPAFKAKAVKALNAVNVYELSTANKHGLLPDHKFPEIRWDNETKAENPDAMTEIEIKQKFQLLDNQRNQQKREVCRKCSQTGKRGKLYGLNYFYAGDENWPDNTPIRGKKAEQGCIGCGWYDIQAWRDSLNKLLSELP